MPHESWSSLRWRAWGVGCAQAATIAPTAEALSKERPEVDSRGFRCGHNPKQISSDRARHVPGTYLARTRHRGSGCHVAEHSGTEGARIATSRRLTRKQKPPAEVGSAGGESGAFAWVAPPWWIGEVSWRYPSWLPISAREVTRLGIGLCELRARPNDARRIHPLANLLETCRATFRALQRTGSSPTKGITDLTSNCPGASEQGVLSGRHCNTHSNTTRLNSASIPRNPRRRAFDAFYRTSAPPPPVARVELMQRVGRCAQSPIRTRFVRHVCCVPHK